MLSGFGVYSIGRNHRRSRRSFATCSTWNLPNMVQMDCAFLAGLLLKRFIKRCPPPPRCRVFL